MAKETPWYSMLLDACVSVAAKRRRHSGCAVKSAHIFLLAYHYYSCCNAGDGISFSFSVKERAYHAEEKEFKE